MFYISYSACTFISIKRKSLKMRSSYSYLSEISSGTEAWTIVTYWHQVLHILNLLSLHFEKVAHYHDRLHEFYILPSHDCYYFFFHNLNMYCRLISDTIAECKTEMHKTTGKTTGTWKMYIFAVSSNVMWYFQNVLCSRFEDLWIEINKNSTKCFCTAQMCICTVLA